MEPFFFTSLDLAQQAAADLKSLGGHARKLLAECVREQGVKRSKASAAANALEGAGFVRIRDSDSVYESDIEIFPTLAGEEALELLEEQEAC